MKLSKRGDLDRINLIGLRSVVVFYYTDLTCVHLYDRNSNLTYLAFNSSENIGGFLLRCKLQGIVVRKTKINSRRVAWF